MRKLVKRAELFLVNLRYRMMDYLINNNEGMGVIEVILIILVLVSLVLIFKTKITTVVNNIFSKLTAKVNSF